MEATKQENSSWLLSRLTILPLVSHNDMRSIHLLLLLFLPLLHTTISTDSKRSYNATPLASLKESLFEVATTLLFAHSIV